MTNFRIWGKVEHVGVRQFIAIVSAVPEDLAQRPIVRTATAPALAEANGSRDQLMREVGEKVCARGDCVVDVEGN